MSSPPDYIRRDLGPYSEYNDAFRCSKENVVCFEYVTCTARSSVSNRPILIPDLKIGLKFLLFLCLSVSRSPHEKSPTSSHFLTSRTHLNKVVCLHSDTRSWWSVFALSVLLSSVSVLWKLYLSILVCLWLISVYVIVMVFSSLGTPLLS
jgi:hypothetical protein